MFEGAEFPNELLEEPPVKPPRGNKRNKSKVSFSSNTRSNQNSSNPMSFDPSSFSHAVQNILDFVIPDDDGWDLDSDSDMSDYGKDDDQNSSDMNDICELMRAMDKELSTTEMGQSFEKAESENFDDAEDFTPVDVDVNALKNILKSYNLQMGEAGPSSNLLGPMGIKLDGGIDDQQNDDVG